MSCLITFVAAMWNGVIINFAKFLDDAKRRSVILLP